MDAATLEYYIRRIRIPANFTDSVLSGKQGKISFSRTGTGLGADYDEILVKRAAYTVLADLVAADTRSGEANPETFLEVQAVPRTLTLEVVPAGGAMDALHKLVSFGDSPIAVLPHLLALTAAVLCAGYLLPKSFRFE